MASPSPSPEDTFMVQREAFLAECARHLASLSAQPPAPPTPAGSEVPPVCLPGPAPPARCGTALTLRPARWSIACGGSRCSCCWHRCPASRRH